MVLGLLLARAGVRVTVLEKHGDFLRDFRGDTVHSSTLTLLDELGLGPAFERVPHQLVERMQVMVGEGLATIADLTRLPGPHKHIALVPQWDFLDLLAEAAGAEPTFELRMNTRVTDLLTEGGRVSGVAFRTADGSTGEIAADLVVAADGRHSSVRARSGLTARSFGAPMDVWWFRVPRDPGEPAGGLARFGAGQAAVLLNRGDHFQVAFLIRKGSDALLRAEGVESFRRRVVALVPWLADRMDTVESLDDVKLLDVKLDRLRRWHTAGLLCIGDAAHAMSPIGGVGINLAVQDAVGAATLLAAPLLRGRVSTAELARVQRRRWLATAVTQGLQRLIQNAFLRGTVEGTRTPEPGLPKPLALIQRFPALQVVPAYLVSIGLRPEHAPVFARRSPAPVPRGPERSTGGRPERG